MKKSLLAVAALTAFAGAAQAQSSVTVYGILDVGFMGGNSTTNISNAAVPSAKVQGNQFGQSGEQTSRLGFKGTEDLGGGMQALFTTEFALYPQDNNLSGNSTNSGLYNRQTFVGLHKNGVGQAAIGLQYTPIFNAAAATDAGQFNNFAGDAVYSSAAGTTGNAGPSTSNIGFTNRIGNALTLQSDAFNGFRVNAMLSDNNKNATEVSNTSTGVASVGGNTNASGWGLGADFTYNKFFITGQYQALKQLTTTLNSDVANSSIWTAAQANGLTTSQALASAGLGQNIQDNQGYVGATYDFGILKAYAQYLTRKATSTVSSNYYLKRSAEQIGVRSFITPAIEGWAQAGLGRYTAFGPNQPTANFNTWQVGSNYWLSKRTNLYAIYGANNTSNAAAGNVTTSYNVSTYGVGIRHTF